MINVIKREVQKGDMVFAVSIDIVNAFNSLPCEKIKEELEHHVFSWYLSCWVGNYLSQSSIEFPVQGGNIVERQLERGIWHDFALGTHLWNIGNNYILDIALHRCVQLICNADDSLLVSGWTSWKSSIRSAQPRMNPVTESIHELVLKVAGENTETVWFFKPAKDNGETGQNEIYPSRPGQQIVLRETPRNNPPMWHRISKGC